ncbi:MAG: N-6 DNA methylase, partial [Bacteroidales bacterium]|nr:N-6 DNA methylase [Bacteroidales bacterium]
MNLLQHVINIRQKIQRALDGKLERLGIEHDAFAERGSLSADDQQLRARLENITLNHIAEKEGNFAEARGNTLNQCVFTLFNRLAAIKLMECKEIMPEVIRQRAEYGGVSQSHLGWLEEHPEGRAMERDGLLEFFSAQFEEMGSTLPLYRSDYPYAMMPTADELNDIIAAINAVDEDAETENAWKGDDILGWLYENFNTAEKITFKESGEKTEYHKVSLQSQVYTPDWVVKFLVDNTLGKLYLEMFPDSTLALPDNDGKYRYPIANRPTETVRRPKDMRSIRLIDPACGSGNFLLYAFDVLYDMYLNQIEQYGKQYDEKKIAKLIIEHNIYGVDLDERAVQLAQIALMIKASEKVSKRNRRKEEYMPCHTNIVSTNFFLPNTEEIQNILTDNPGWGPLQKNTVKEIWSDLCQAYKFGSLVRVEEKLQAIEPNHDEVSLFTPAQIDELFSIKNLATGMIREQVNKWGAAGSNAFTLTKANDAVSFLEILSHKFDVVVANPPYT